MRKISTLFWGTSGICAYTPRRCAAQWTDKSRIPSQGRRKLRKVGGGRLWGALFEKKRALKNFFGMTSPPFPPPVAKKILVSVPFWGSKKFSGHTTVFTKHEKNFPEIHKNFPHIWYFSPKLKHFSGNNIYWSFQKGTLAKKCNFNEFFSRKKRALCNRKKGTCQNLGGLAPHAPPRFLCPCPLVASK